MQARNHVCTCGGGIEIAKKRLGISDGLKATTVASWTTRSRRTWDARTFRNVSCLWQAQRFTFCQCWRGYVADPIGTDVRSRRCRFQHFRRVRYRFRGRLRTFARSGTGFAAGPTDDFVASATVSQGQLHIWCVRKAQPFCQVDR